MEHAEKVTRTSLNMAVPADVDAEEGQRPARELRREAGLVHDNRVSFRIPTNEDARIHVHNTHGHESWRAKILSFLHQPAVQWTLIALLLLDVLILFAELFLGAHYPLCMYVTRDAISCCPLDGAADAHSNIRLLAEDSHESFCQDPMVETDNPAGCDPHKWATVHNVEEALFIMTMTILSIFFVEISLLMLALTPCIFFRQFWYVLDFIIVAVSIALEAWFHVKKNDLAAALSGIVVVARCWRFVRVSHGLMSATAEMTSLKYEEIVKLAEELERLLKEHEQKLHEHDDHSEDDTVYEFREKNKALLHKLHEHDEPS